MRIAVSRAPDAERVTPLELFFDLVYVFAIGHVPRSRPLGLAALAILAVATARLTLIVGIAASTAVLA